MDVLAVVRNKSSADKISRNLDIGETLPTDNVTMVEADVTSDGDDGVKGVVEKVRNGKLQGFQHVYSTGMCRLHRRLGYPLDANARQLACIISPAFPSTISTWLIIEE